MNLAEIPLVNMLRERLGYLSERQRVIAQNVANSDTAGYAAKDLKPFSFHAAQQGAAAPVQLGRVPGAAGKPAHWREVKAPGSETTLNGNSVVLEDEMLKMSEARMNYDAAIGFYQKSLNLLRMASRPPGR